jgi:glucose/arabinose dehydrogenase
VVAALVLVVGCGDDDGATATTTTSAESTIQEPTTTTSPVAADEVELDDVRIELTEVVQLDQPLDLAVRQGDGDLYIAEKGGRVVRVAPDATTTTVLDISDEVSSGNEQGLLGITFSPDGTRLYVHYTNVDGDTRVEERPFDGNVTGAPRTILEVDQPYGNHNGGRITFGPDEQLYLGLGDGGSSGDPHGNGQNPDALLGKILRINPEDPSGPLRYAIGLRNPWRFSFDRANGDMWIGDVGQNAWEEVDRIAAGTEPGVNLGWNLLEATHGFHATHDPGGTLLPVYEYNHDVGQSVVGGFVYRGTKIPTLQGVYLFADTYAGNLQALRLRGDTTEHADLGITAPEGFVVSFGEDVDGELYVLSLNGGVYRIEGT